MTKQNGHQEKKNQATYYLEKEKSIFLKRILLFLILSGSILAMIYLFGEGITLPGVAQLLACFYFGIILLDYHIRGNTQQTSNIAAFSGLFFLCYKYYSFQAYLAPTAMWLLIIPPTLVWLNGNRHSLFYYFGTMFMLTCTLLAIYISIQRLPNTMELMFIIGSVVVSAYITFMIHQNQKVYTYWMRRSQLLKNEEIHKGQLTILGEFAGNIAHEMNNPFQVIKGNAAILSKRLKKYDDEELVKIRKYATNIDRTVDRTKKLIDGLLRLARFPGDEIKLDLYPFSEVWNLAFPLVETKVREQNVTLQIRNIELEIYTHRDFLAQIILNLINNSLYEVRGHQKPWITIDVSSDHIDVIDSGTGVPPEIREHLIEPFFTTKKDQGTGLGLSLCQNLLYQMGGDLEVIDEAKNTTFRIHLPTSTT